MYKKTRLAITIALLVSLFGVIAMTPRVAAETDTNAPTTIRDEFSGDTIIADPNYSTGIAASATPKLPTFLAFNELPDAGLSVAQARAVRDILTSRFKDARYIALERGNITSSDEKDIVTRIQINRSTIYDAVIRYVKGSDTALIVTLKKGDSTLFSKINKLPLSEQGISIKQTSDTSSAVAINASNKEAALRKLMELDYKIPDLSVTFENYRNPFE